MKILAVDTAFDACSAAVLDGDDILAHHFELMARGHAERLAPMVREAMEVSRIGFGDLERLAVTIGPGTFTGQRVGFAFMRGLRLALTLPLAGVTTLEAMAAAALHATRAAAAAVLQDARRGEVYTVTVSREAVVLPVSIAPLETALSAIGRAMQCASCIPLALAGTAAPGAALHLRAWGAVELTNLTQPDALWVARLARAVSEPQSVPQPLYLRAPDAKIPAGPQRW